MTCGIYSITCVPTGKFYVGSSVNIEGRWRQHRCHLKAGKHHSVLLQRSWDKYGADAFVFAITLEVDAEFLLDKEQEVLDTEQPFAPHGFNICKTVSGMDTVTRLRMSSTRLGRKHSKETRDKLAHKNSTVPRRTSKKVVKVDVVGNVLDSYPSINAAAKSVGRDFKNLWLCTQNPHLTCAGFHWRVIA